MNLKTMITVAELALKIKSREWTFSDMSDAELEELIERASRSLDRFTSYAKVIMENLELGQATPLYDKIMVEEFGYTPDMPFPSISSWWPIGMNYGLEEIRAKYAFKE